MIKRPDINQYLIDFGLDWFRNGELPTHSKADGMSFGGHRLA